MKQQLLLYSLIMLVCTFISSVAQVMLKKAAMRNYSSRAKEYLNIMVITAYSIFFMATIMGIVAYKVVPLSMGPILDASSYIYVTFFGAVIFKERITIRKILAVAVIICGIVLFALG